MRSEEAAEDADMLRAWWREDVTARDEELAALRVELQRARERIAYLEGRVSWRKSK